jgi:hypothetical protein
MQCSNKLKQLALACHTYHDAHNEFPMNGDNNQEGEHVRADGVLADGVPVSGTPDLASLPSSGGVPGNGNVSGRPYYGAQQVSMFVFIGPFVERSAQYELFREHITNAPVVNSEGSVYDWGAVDFYDPELLRQPAEFMACPSDSNANQEVTADIGGTARYHRTSSYVASAGDWCVQTGWDPTGLALRGFAGWTRGAFFYTAATTLSDIADGTSNTAMLTERCAGTVADNTNNTGGPPYRTVVIESTSVFGAMSGTIPFDSRAPESPNAPSASTFNPGAGLALVSGSRVKAGEDTWGAVSTRWYNGRTRNTWANFILGPNAPACGNGEGRSNSHAILPPQSYHTGGVNMALCDASVRFVTDAVDTGTITSTDTTNANPALNRRSGPSPYGVWGAFGSRGGGEATAMP